MKLVSAVLGLVFVFAACSPAARNDLTVFGAASLGDALAAVKPAWEAANPLSTLTISTGSSSALRTQIEQGAPADVFLSADTTNPQALVDGEQTAGEPVEFANNSLVVVVPSDNPAGITSPADLANEGVQIVAAGEEVPITRYAEEVVGNLEGLDGYPADFAAAYESNVVSREENVAAVMSKIELGEGDAAIVYVTDATGSDAQSVDIPAEANIVAEYAGVAIKSGTHQAQAQAFLTWLAGTAGADILGEFGFAPAQ